MKRSRITELDGLRVIMIVIVSWYHIWQQSWLTPYISIPSLNFFWSLDWLVRSGYVWVDGTVLLSAFLLYLPLARQEGRGIIENPGDFYFRKAKRLLPGFWFIILVFFFAMCLPWGLYRGDGAYMVKDLFTHFTLTFTFWRDTYIWTPLGAAPWTLSLVAQGYLLFPLLAEGMKKHPGITLGMMVGGSFAFRAWCIWGMTDYAMVVNCLANFLDVYAIGFGAAMLFAKLEKWATGTVVQGDGSSGPFVETSGGDQGDGSSGSFVETSGGDQGDGVRGSVRDHGDGSSGPSKRGHGGTVPDGHRDSRECSSPAFSRKRVILVQVIATIVFVGSIIGLCEMLKVQARSSGQENLQMHQMMYRPVFGLCFAGMILSAPFMWKPLRWLLGNRVMVFLSTVSMSYYLIHQTLAVHLKRLGWPPSLSDTPNTAGEYTWQWQYTLAVFVLSLLAAIFVTYCIEKPAGKWMQKLKDRKAV